MELTIGNYLNTGGRYNPGTDSWTATSTTNAPSGRYDHTAVWTGSEMIVWGGIDDSGILNTGGRYCAPFSDAYTDTDGNTYSNTYTNSNCARLHQQQTIAAPVHCVRRS